MKCKDCEYLKAYPPRNNGIRYSYECGHKDQKYIYDYHRKHNLLKHPPFICYGSKQHRNIPTIKTSPAWCPRKKEDVK